MKTGLHSTGSLRSQSAPPPTWFHLQPRCQEVSETAQQRLNLRQSSGQPSTSATSNSNTRRQLQGNLPLRLSVKIWAVAFFMVLQTTVPLQADQEWSPDGRWLAFTVKVSPSQEIDRWFWKSNHFHKSTSHKKEIWEAAPRAAGSQAPQWQLWLVDTASLKSSPPGGKFSGGHPRDPDLSAQLLITSENPLGSLAWHPHGKQLILVRLRRQTAADRPSGPAGPASSHRPGSQEQRIRSSAQSQHQADRSTSGKTPSGKTPVGLPLVGKQAGGQEADPRGKRPEVWCEVVRYRGSGSLEVIHRSQVIGGRFWPGDGGAAWHPSGGQLAVTLPEGLVILDGRTGQRLQTASKVQWPVFSPCGRFLTTHRRLPSGNWAIQLSDGKLQGAQTVASTEWPLHAGHWAGEQLLLWVAEPQLASVRPRSAGNTLKSLWLSHTPQGATRVVMGLPLQLPRQLQPALAVAAGRGVLSFVRADPGVIVCTLPRAGEKPWRLRAFNPRDPADGVTGHPLGLPRLPIGPLELAPQRNQLAIRLGEPPGVNEESGCLWLGPLDNHPDGNNPLNLWEMLLRADSGALDLFQPIAPSDALRLQTSWKLAQACQPPPAKNNQANRNQANRNQAAANGNQQASTPTRLWLPVDQQERLGRGQHPQQNCHLVARWGLRLLNEPKPLRTPPAEALRLYFLMILGGWDEAEQTLARLDRSQTGPLRRLKVHYLRGQLALAQGHASESDWILEELQRHIGQIPSHSPARQQSESLLPAVGRLRRQAQLQMFHSIPTPADQRHRH